MTSSDVVDALPSRPLPREEIEAIEDHDRVDRVEIPSAGIRDGLVVGFRIRFVTGFSVAIVYDYRETGEWFDLGPLPDVSTVAQARDRLDTGGSLR